MCHYSSLICMQLDCIKDQILFYYMFTILYTICFVSTEAITSVMVQNSTIPINNENFTLTCEVTGPYDKIYWMKDNMYLNMNTSMEKANMSYHIQNNMLHLTPVTLYNDGSYQCVATNKAANHTSPPHMLLVNCECCRKQWRVFLFQTHSVH